MNILTHLLTEKTDFPLLLWASHLEYVTLFAPELTFSAQDSLTASAVLLLL